MSLLKKILLVLWLLLGLAACGPIQTYDEIEAEAKRTGDTTRLERFEKTAHKAEQHFQLRALCMADDELIWYCRDRERFDEDRPPQTVDKTVRVYRYDRFSCACVAKKDFIL